MGERKTTNERYFWFYLGMGCALVGAVLSQIIGWEPIGVGGGLMMLGCWFIAALP